MKRTIAAATALLLATGAASAADLTSLKDVPAARAGALAGPYIEFAIGEGFSQSTLGAGLEDFGIPTGGNLSATGGVVVARAGYDKTLGSRFGLGVYVEGSNTFDVNGSAGGLSFGENWAWGAGAKAFYDHGGGQLYAILGYAGTTETAGGTTHQLDGLEWGVGMNLKVAGNFYAKLEFDQVLYSDLSQFSTSVPVKWSQVDDRVLFGLGYSLGGY